MNLLGIETSTLRAAIAIQTDDGSRYASSTDPGRRHGRDLVPAIRDLLHAAGLRATDLGAIGVGTGPGSYTGVRVGIMAAKTLAYATGARLVSLSSLEFFARAAGDDAERVSVLSDAQRGDFHVAEFARDRITHELNQVGPLQIRTQNEIAAAWVDPRIVLGPALNKWQDQWPVGVTPIPAADHADPRILLDLLREALDRDEFERGWELEPVYLRRSSAEDLWDKKR